MQQGGRRLVKSITSFLRNDIEISHNLNHSNQKLSLTPIQK